MNSLTSKTLAALVAMTAAGAVAHADVCANPVLTNLSSITRSNAPVSQTCLDLSTRTDMSSRIKDSYNTAGSFNTKTQFAATDVASKTNQTTVDTQAAANDAKQIGPQQSAGQGGFYLGSASAGTNSIGGGYFSPVQTGSVRASNSSTINGPNWGNVTQSNVASSAGDAVGGDKAGILNSVLGNSQSQSAGGQTLGQSNSQQKTSSNQSYAATPVTVRQH
jgi:hypothetical protein